MKIFVFLWHSLDAKKYRAAFDSGQSSDRSPYGYHHAAELPDVSVSFSDSRAEGLFASTIRRGLAAILGFDLVHLFRNRASASAADVIWCHSEREALALTFWFRVLRRSSVPKLLLQCVWLMDAWPTTPVFRRWIYSRCLREADLLIFHSELNAAAGRIFGETKTCWVPFGISTETFPIVDPGSRALRKTGAPIRILSPGNDVHRDWECLIDAFGGDSRFTVHVASSSFPTAELTRRGIDNFQVASAKSIAELQALYAQCDLLVLPLRPNLHVSGATVILEAVSQGIPVIASLAGGLDGYFEKDEVAFVPVGESAAMRERAALLADNGGGAFELAKKAQQKFLIRDYSSRGYARRQVDLSRRLLVQDPAPS